ncbi:hypothetical protein Gotur_008042 [Gossypium turneri]
MLKYCRRKNYKIRSNLL